MSKLLFLSVKSEWYWVVRIMVNVKGEIDGLGFQYFITFLQKKYILDNFFLFHHIDFFKQLFTECIAIGLSQKKHKANEFSSVK